MDQPIEVAMPSLEKDPAEEKILQQLANIHVCKRCVIRIFKGNFGDYSVDDTEEEVEKGYHCCTCLGILEGHTLSNIRKTVIEKIEKQNYDSSTFQLGIAIPNCIKLRQSSVIAYLRDNGDCKLMKEFPGVKNIAKIFISKYIEKMTNKVMAPQSNLFIKIDFSFPGDAKEISKLDALLQRRLQRAKVGGKMAEQAYRTDNIERVVQSLSDSDLKRFAVCPPQTIANACKFSVNITHSSVFIGGRYNKYSRGLSQTPWFVEGVRRGDTSTLELIGEKLKQAMNGEDIRFLSAGREDADVRMLGKGRPFAVEITDPKVTSFTAEQMVHLQSEINSSTELVAVRDLQVVDKSGLELMKKGEEEKQKTYRAKLWCPEPISDELIAKLNKMSDIELQQNTPIRVLHRRPIATRVRKVHEIEMKEMDEKDCYELNLKTQAGTYVKEFVHGDFGRTDPSLRTILGVPIDIVELDVMSIEMNWPPETEDGINTKNGTHLDGGELMIVE